MKVQSDAATADELGRLLEELPRLQETQLRQLRTLLEVPTTSVRPEWPATLEHARGRVDVRYPEPATSHRPLVGPALVLAKRLFRGVSQPFINEVLRKQVEFNEAILAAVMQLHETVRQTSHEQALWRDELSRRDTAGGPPPKKAAVRKKKSR